jgi:hypothetical protein
MSAGGQESLRVETAFFDSMRAEWLKDHGGEWALVRGRELLGFFPSLEEAYTHGRDRFGIDPFLVKRVVPTDPVEILHRGSRVKRGP